MQAARITIQSQSAPTLNSSNASGLSILLGVDLEAFTDGRAIGYSKLLYQCSIPAQQLTSMAAVVENGLRISTPQSSSRAPS